MIFFIVVVVLGFGVYQHWKLHLKSEPEWMEDFFVPISSVSTFVYDFQIKYLKEV